MKTLLKKIFIKNWLRKCLSIILAIIIWFVINKSLMTTQTLHDVPVRVENIPPGKTVEGLNKEGILNQRINLIITGNKRFLEDLTSTDIEVIIDATNQDKEWIASIDQKNLRTTNLNLNLSRGISKVFEQNLIIKLSNLVTEKIPIIITKPLGYAPKGYYYLDSWPRQLYISVSGPENIIKKLKNHGLKLTFNLNDISKSQLDHLALNTKKTMDVISFLIPDEWKRIPLPSLANTPIAINDPQAKYLRLDFLRYELLQINTPIPITFYFPQNNPRSINQKHLTFTSGGLIENRNGMPFIQETLYAQGVSHLFMEIVKGMLQVVILVTPKETNEPLDWSLQLVHPAALEDRYISALLSDVHDKDIQPDYLDHLRNRFRRYANRIQLFKSPKKKLELYPYLQKNTLIIQDVRRHDAS